MRNLLALSLLLLLVACAPFKEPEFEKYDGFEMGKRDGTKSIDFKIKATVNNPNFYALKVKPSTVEVFINGEKVGDIHLTEKIKMKARKSTSLEVPLHADLEKGVMMKLMSIAVRDSVFVQIKGDVKGGALFIYRTFPVDFKKNVSSKGLNPLKLKN